MSRPDLGAIIAQTMAPPAQGRTIEVITDEILNAQRRGGQAVLDIGRGLLEAKSMLLLSWIAEGMALGAAIEAAEEMDHAQ